MNNYWLIESDEAKAKWDKLAADAEQKRATAREWMIAQGGTGKCLNGLQGSIDAIQFIESPEKDWKENKYYSGYYAPKRNTKVGKSLFCEMIKLQSGMIRETVGEIFLGHQWIFSGCSMLRCGWENSDKGIILMAIEGEGDAQWKPTEGLRKLKNSEYWAIKETE